MITGFTCGAFDLCHTGHLILFSMAREQCDKLIVGLHTAPHLERASKQPPLETTFERYVRLKACRWVDEVIPYDTERDLANMLYTLPLDVRFVDENYRDIEFTGKHIIPVVYLPRRHDYSSTHLRTDITRSPL